MTVELYWLTLTVLMTALFWLVYIFDRMAVRGIPDTLSAAPPKTGTPQSTWAQRAIYAHRNAVENLVIFAPLVLIAHLMQITTPATRAAVVVYFGARLIHFIVYTAGIPVVRTLAFTAGWAAQILLAANILNWF